MATSLLSTIMSDESNHLSVIQKMDQSGFTFHLTGSRAFKTHKNGSDYDFYSRDSEELRKWLKENKFECIFDASNPDAVSMSKRYAFQHQDGWGGLNAVFRRSGIDIQIDVQLVSDTETKNIAQKLLLQNVALLSYNKSQAYLVWRLAFDAAKLIQHYQQVAGESLQRARLETPKLS